MPAVGSSLWVVFRRERTETCSISRRAEVGRGDVRTKAFDTDLDLWSRDIV